MRAVPFLPRRLKLLVVALFWVVLPTPSDEQPVLVDESSTFVVEGDDRDRPEVFWDPSPAVPTARLEASNGATDAVVEVRPPSPSVGERVQVRLTTMDRRGRSVSGSVHFGAARGPNLGMIVDCLAPEFRSKSHDKPRHTTDVSEYVFHAPGRHRMGVFLEIVDCESRDELVVSGELDVRDGSSTPNEQPIAAAAVDVVAASAGGLYGQHLITVRVRDPDGFLHHAHVDFGDGSAPAVFTEEHRWLCRDEPARRVGYDETSTVGHHTFPGRRQFTMRVSVTTMDCAKTRPQTTTVTRTVATQ